jgi:hypothetical protein
MMRIHMHHIRQAKMCSRGARDFFVRHGLDWPRFLEEGLPEEDFINTQDAMALHVVEVANGRV